MKTIRHYKRLAMLLLLFTFTNTAVTMKLLNFKTDRNNDGYDDSQLYRIKRHERGYMRGQTQSQYMNFGKPDVDAGKAEAEANENGSRSIVYGSQGMGQAQSQFSMDNCNECYTGTVPFTSVGRIGTTLHPTSKLDSVANRTQFQIGVPGTGGSITPLTTNNQGIGGQIPGTTGPFRGMGSSYGTQVPGSATYGAVHEPGGSYIPGGSTAVKTQPSDTGVIFGNQMTPNTSAGQITQFPQSGSHFVRKPSDSFHVDVSPGYLPTPTAGVGGISQTPTDSKVIAYETSPERKIPGQGPIMGAQVPSGTPAFRESPAPVYTPIYDTRPTAAESSTVIPQTIGAPYGTYSTHPLKTVYTNGQQPGSVMQPVMYPSGYKPSYSADKSYGSMGAPGLGIGVGQIITIAPLHPHTELVKQSLPPSIQQPTFTYTQPAQPISPQSSTAAKPDVQQTTVDTSGKTDKYPAAYNVPRSQLVIPTDTITRGLTPAFSGPSVQQAPTMQANLPSGQGMQTAVLSQGKPGILRLGQVAYTQLPTGSIYTHPNLASQAIPEQTTYLKPQLPAEYSQMIPTAGVSRQVTLPSQGTSTLAQKTDLPANVNVYPGTGYPQTIGDVTSQQHVMQQSAVNAGVSTVPQSSLPTYTSTGLGYMQPASSRPDVGSFQQPRLQPSFPQPQISDAKVQPQSSFTIPPSSPQYTPPSYSGLQQFQPMQPISVHTQPGSGTITGTGDGYFRTSMQPQLPITGAYDSGIRPGTSVSGAGMQTETAGYIGKQTGDTSQTPVISPSAGYGGTLPSNVRYEQYVPTYDGAAIGQPGSVTGYRQPQYDLQPYQGGISKEGHTATLPQTGSLPTYTQPGQFISSMHNDSMREGGKEILQPSVTGLGYRNDTFQVDASKGDTFSQAETSINNGQASASAEGKRNGGSAKTLVQGTYTSTGSFSASAMTSDNDRSANSQVSGSVQGAMSQAQAQGGPAQSQAQVQVNKNTGGTKASSQSNGLTHQSQSEVQANDKGGLADAQSSGPGQTSSQAQIGFRPGANDENNPPNGVVQASSQSGLHSGQSQSQIQGKSKLGITYYGAAQSASGTKDQVAGYREKTKDVFNSINQFENAESRSNLLGNTINTSSPALISDSRQPSNVQLKASKKFYKNVHFSNTSDDENTIILGEEDGEDHYDEYDDDEDYNGDVSIKMDKHSDTQLHKTSRLFSNDLQLRRHRQDMPLPPAQQIYNSTANSKVQKYNRHLVKYSSRSTTETTVPNGFRGTINIEKNIHTKALEIQNSDGKMNASAIDIKPPTHDSYVTVTKSVTGTMENSKDSAKDNRNFQSTFYTKSSTCGYFTFSCNIVYGENGRSKICRPKAPTKGSC